MNLPPLLAAISFLMMMGTAWSAEPATAARGKESNCIEQMNERTAAMVAEDWSQLERSATRYLKSCKGVFGAEDYSEAYEKSAIANYNLGNFALALAASDKCISVFYANSACHVQRVQALVALARLPDGQVALDKAERLIKHAIDVGQRDLKTAQNEIDRELFQARLANFASQQNLASAIRERYFTK